MSKKDKKKGKKPKLRYSDNVAMGSIKKELRQEARDLAVICAAVAWDEDPTDPVLISNLRIAVERLPLRSRPEQAESSDSSGDETPYVDLSVVMIGPDLRTRVMDLLDLTPREHNHLNRVISAVIHTAQSAQAVNEQSLEANLFKDTRLAGGESGRSEIDLATLMIVPDSLELQAVIRHKRQRDNRPSYMGPKGVALLRAFADKAKELVLADALAANSD